MTFSPATVWDRVVAAVDHSPESVAAAKTAARLMPAAASLTMVAVRDPHDGDQPTGDQAAIDQAQRAFRALQALHDVELHLREGYAIERILDELHARQATLLTLGARDHHPEGMLLGRVTTALIRDAQASMLIAHEEVDSSGDIVVGFDGSGGARRALVAAQELSGRTSLGVRVLIATGDAGAAERAREDLDPAFDVVVDPRGAVEALTGASQSAALIAVGSRHLQGALAAASISEHTAERAHCPVLVMR